MKSKIKNLINKRFNVSFSKSGDDIQLYKLINNNTPGVYVDIGCWDPIKASNTYFFYLRGWKGICIDPNPELVEMYKSTRPSDIFINTAISRQSKQYKYYMLNDHYSSMNTMDYDFILKNNIEKEIKSVIPVKKMDLKDVLSQNLLPGDRLDFFDIDVEGLDLDVLETNDWQKYRPKYIIIETDFNIKIDVNSDITKFLESVNYELIGKSIINGDLGNLFFVNKQL
jgi:FkbM family methyltransferase